MRFLQEGSVEERVLMAMAAVQKFVERCHGAVHQNRLKYVHERTIGRWKLKIEELLRAMPEEVTSDDAASIEQEVARWQRAIEERDLPTLDHLLYRMDRRWQGWMEARQRDRERLAQAKGPVCWAIWGDVF